MTTKHMWLLIAASVASIGTSCSDSGGSGTPTLPPAEQTPTPPLATSTLPLELDVTNSGSVVINELLAKNDTINVDEAEQNDDWLELYNRGSDAVDVSGWTLSDDPQDEEPWAIPDGTVIASGDFLLIWCDEDEDDGPLHASFKLGAEGEQITLRDASGDVAERLTFGALEADIAWGRLVDGGDDFGQLAPSPASSNGS